MAKLDALAPNYRRAVERWPDAPMLSRSYDALLVCFEGNAHGMVEHVKSFLESVCLTILGEFGEPMPSSTPSTTDLLIAALQPLGLENTRGASKLDKVLSGFNRLADALTEMRNALGAVAHGKDAFLDPVSADHARAFLHLGDAVLSLLLNGLEGKEPNLLFTREPYERFSDLHERIDRSVGVEARVDDDGEREVIVFTVAAGPLGDPIELKVEPSRLLFGVDRYAYVDVLRTTGTQATEIEEEHAAAVRPEAEAPELTKVSMGTPTSEVVPSYGGRLAFLHPALEEFLVAEGCQVSGATAVGEGLADSLLATADQNMGLDWKQRELLRARLKIALKRVLVKFGLDIAKAEDVAERLVAWMGIQAPDADEKGRETG